MPLSYRRAWVRRIRSAAKTRQKTRPMDVHVHVTILRLHSEYLARLCTEVSAQLGTLEQTLSEGTALTAAENGGRLAEVASLQRRFCTEGGAVLSASAPVPRGLYDRPRWPGEAELEDRG